MATSNRIVITNVGEVTGALRLYAIDYPFALAASVYQMGFILLEKAIKHPIPRQFSVLLRSGYVAPPTAGPGFVVEVGFGTKYARRQHFEHKTRSGYLENPMRQMASSFARDLVPMTARNVKNKTRPGQIRSPYPGKPKTPTEAQMASLMKRRAAAGKKARRAAARDRRRR